MSLLLIVILSAACLLAAYWTYGRVLTRLLRLDRDAPTPSIELRDDVDYAPLEPNALLSQHFSAIAAAGPIVGPILAGAMFGWLPALIWILVGSIFIGGVHDMTALVASIRHKARSIAEVVREHMSQRSFVLFLTFVWLALVYIIVAFTDITAESFIGKQTLENGQEVTGAGIASSSLMYLALPIIMGLLLRYTRLTLGWATVIFLPLVGVSIWAGQLIPVDVEAYLQWWNPSLTDVQANQMAHKGWDVALLAYCCVASVVPMWILLQPRGHLGGYFLYVALAGGALGLIFGDNSIRVSRVSRLDGRQQRAVSDSVHHHCLRGLFGVPLADCFRDDVETIAQGDRRAADWLRGHAAGSHGGHGFVVLRHDSGAGLRCAEKPEAKFHLCAGHRQLSQRDTHSARDGRLVRTHGVYDVCVRHAGRLHAAGAIYRARTDRLARSARTLAGHCY